MCWFLQQALRDIQQVPVCKTIDNKVRFDSPHFDVSSTMRVTLESPNVATDEQGNKGTWTMVYDEGFEVRIAGKTLFAFFVYEPKVSDPRPDENADFSSICDETFTGWYHGDDESTLHQLCASPRTRHAYAGTPSIASYQRVSRSQRPPRGRRPA